MSKKRKRPAKNATSDDCVIPPAISIEAAASLLFERDEKTAEEISAYVEGQSPGETVTHAEMVMAQRVLGRKYECWDVRTTKARLWVITSPTNLYDHNLFPSLDYTLTFHIGLAARMMAKHEPEAGVLEEITMPAAWRKWSQAGEALNVAEEPEDFQSVGMRCRESMIAMVRILALPAMVPVQNEPPEASRRSSMVHAHCQSRRAGLQHGARARLLEGRVEDRLAARQLAYPHAWSNARRRVDGARSHSACAYPIRHCHAPSSPRRTRPLRVLRLLSFRTVGRRTRCPNEATLPILWMDEGSNG